MGRDPAHLWLLIVGNEPFIKSGAQRRIIQIAESDQQIAQCHLSISLQASMNVTLGRTPDSSTESIKQGRDTNQGRPSRDSGRRHQSHVDGVLDQSLPQNDSLHEPHVESVDEKLGVMLELSELHCAKSEAAQPNALSAHA